MPKQNYNVECSFVCKNGNLGQITDLDARRIKHLADNLPNKLGWKVINAHRGNKEDSQYIVASMEYEGYDGNVNFTVKFPRKSDFPVGDMVITWDNSESEYIAKGEYLEEHLVDEIASCLADYPLK